MTPEYIIIVRNGSGDIVGAVRPDPAASVVSNSSTIEILKNDIPDKSWTYELVIVSELGDYLESLFGAFQS